jgi:DeoR family deoxyribose operon repressor
MAYSKKERLRNIVSLLNQKAELTVKEIAEHLNVSDMTIRRDLTELESRRVIQRTHGGATLFDASGLVYDPYILGEQTQRNFRQKNLIGATAAGLVRPNETVFMDSGSTTPFVAKHMDKELPVTVLCYTFTNAIEFYPRSSTNLILLGGFFHRDSNIFHSPESLVLIRNMRADKAFISTAGLDPHLGLTTIFYFEADIKREMIRSARQIIVVADSSKFGKISVAHFAGLGEVHTVITDEGISAEYRKILEEMGIELIIAGQAAPDDQKSVEGLGL